MKLINQGKTKDVYEISTGNVLLVFKDDVTGENGIFDPGANTVGSTIKGIGESNLKLSEFFFELLQERGIPTHYIETKNQTTMMVKKVKLFGNGLEVICRFKAVGSFLRRYGMYASEGQVLNSFVEFTLKDDKRKDPPITKDALNILGILSSDDYEILKKLTISISNIIKDCLAKKGIELWDIKLEFGRVDGSNEIVLIDEISTGNMRAYKDGRLIEPLQFEKMVLS